MSVVVPLKNGTFVGLRIVSLLVGEEGEHGPVVEYFTNWCREADLNLNTEEMCIDLWWKQELVLGNIVDNHQIIN